MGIKTSKSILSYLTLIGISFCALSASAVSKKTTNTKAKKTVAELISQMNQSNRGGKEKLNKTKADLPVVSLPFQNSGRNLEAVKPPSSSVLFSGGGVKADYERILDKQIEELYGLTKRFKDSKNRGELWLRLAELYIEKATIIDTRKQDEFDLKLKAFQEGKLAKKPKLELAEARAYNQKAVQLYEWFLRDFPNDQKVPQALFFLGFNFSELGDEKKSILYFENLTKKYPNSQFVSEAYFALGEHYFDNEKWVNAYKNYSHIIKDKGHRLYTMSLYKSAWCLYRLGKYKSALSYMEYIIRTGKNETGTDLATRKTVNRMKLESEALRDVIIFYADVGDAKSAPEYLRKLVGEDINPYLEKLASYYSDRGNRDASSIVLRQLIDLNPTHPRAIEYQYQIVQNYFYAKNSNKFKEELYRWIADYDQKGKWFQANELNTDLVANSQRLREQTLRNYIMQQHQTAQNSRGRYSQNLTSEAYQLYLSEFSSSTEYPNMRFFYAELLYDMGKFDDASLHYNWVVQNAPTSKYFNQASLGLIHAVEKSMPSDKDLLKKQSQNLDPIPFDPRVDRFIKASSWYAEKFPSSDKVPEIRFRVARLYYLHNYFDQAMDGFKDIVKKYPKTKYAEYSANLILDIYNLKKDYIGLAKTGGELLAVPAIADSKAGSDIRDVLEKANFKKAQDLETQKNYLESAQQFEAFANQNPKSDLLASARFNAAVNYERAGVFSLAVLNYNRVVEPKTKATEEQKSKSRRLLAKIYQNSGQFEAAARLFRQLSEDNPKDPLSQNFIFTSAALFEALGRLDEAAKSYEAYIKNSRSNKEKLEAIFSIAQIHRKARQKAAALGRYEEYVSIGLGDPERIIESLFWLMQISKELGQVDEAQSWAKRVQSYYKNMSTKKRESVSKYAAQAKLYAISFKIKEYEAVKLSNDPSKLRKTLNEKLQHLEVIKANIAEVIQYNAADEIVSALTLLGKAFQHMGDSILRVPVPRELNEQEKKAYREKVQSDLVSPQQNQANEAFKKAVLKAWEFDVGGEDYNFALSKLNSLDSRKFYDGGEISIDSRYVNWILQ